MKRRRTVEILFAINLLGMAALSLPLDNATLIYAWPYTGLWQAALLLPVFSAIAAFALGGAGASGITKLFGAGIAVLLASFAASTYLSECPSRSALCLLPLLAALALGYLAFAALAGCASPGESLARLSRALLVIALLVSSRSLLFWTVSYLTDVLPVAKKVNLLLGQEVMTPAIFNLSNIHPFGHRLFVAGYSLLFLPLAFSMFFAEKGGWKFASGAAAAILSVMLISAASRAASSILPYLQKITILL